MVIKNMLYIKLIYPFIYGGEYKKTSKVLVMKHFFDYKILLNVQKIVSKHSLNCDDMHIYENMLY